MLAATQIAAFLGVGLAAGAYLPQILHLAREHCAAGISRLAFRTWLLAAVLITSHAIATGAVAFIALGVVQVVATSVILVYAARYASLYCTGHERGLSAGKRRSTRQAECFTSGPLTDDQLPPVVRKEVPLAQMQ